MSVRGIPAQELPENRDPETLYNLDEMTGVRTPIEVPAKAPKRRSKKDTSAS